MVNTWSEPTGTVQLDGALWRARRAYCEAPQEPLHTGDPVVVERLDGLTVTVRRAETWELAP
jgi:membrane-bound serine protease (ClpP class)